MNISSPHPPGSPLVSKLNAFARLSAEDRQALARLTTTVVRVDARRDLIEHGDKPQFAHLVLEGWAARYKGLPDGKRQVVGLFLPGDFCDLNVYILRRMDHSIGAITGLKLARIAPDQMERLTSEHPRITQALFWHELVSAAIQREWLLNIGQRSAHERLGHLLLELYFRMRTVGLARNGRCDFPLTQADLAETTGLTTVHVNRMLQELRAEGLIELERRQLHIPDLQRLMDVTMFNPDYLHLDHEGSHMDANATN